MVPNPTFTIAAISGECATLGLVGKCCSYSIVHMLSAHHTLSLYTNCDHVRVLSRHCLHPASWQIETACQIVCTRSYVLC